MHLLNGAFTTFGGNLFQGFITLIENHPPLKALLSSLLMIEFI